MTIENGSTNDHIALDLDSFTEGSAEVTPVADIFEDASFDAEVAARSQVADDVVVEIEAPSLLTPAEKKSAKKSTDGKSASNNRVANMIKAAQDAASKGKTKRAATVSVPESTTAAPAAKGKKPSKEDKVKADRAKALQDKKDAAEKKKADALEAKAKRAEDLEAKRAAAELRKAERAEKVKQENFAPIDYDMPEQYVVKDFEIGIEMVSELYKRGSNAAMEIGWLLCSIQTSYGKKSIEAVAKAAKIGKSVANKYRWVAGRISPAEVISFEGRLFFSHYQEAAALPKEEMMAALRHASGIETGEDVMTIEAFKKYLHGDKEPKKQNAVKLSAGHFLVITSREDFDKLYEDGMVIFGAWTKDKGNYVEDAVNNNLYNGLVSVTAKSLVDEE